MGHTGHRPHRPEATQARWATQATHKRHTGAVRMRFYLTSFRLGRLGAVLRKITLFTACVACPLVCTLLMPVMGFALGSLALRVRLLCARVAKFQESLSS